MSREDNESKRTLLDKALFHAILYGSPHGFVLIRNGRIHFANEAVAQLLGHSREKLMDKDVQKLLKLIDFTENEDGHSRMQSIITGKSESDRLDVHLKDQEGHKRTLNIITQAQMIGKERIVWAFILDVTEDRLSEKALQESENRFDTLFRESPVSMWEEDFSDVKKFFQELTDSGIKDFRKYFSENRNSVIHCANLVRIVRVNRATIEMQGVEGEKDLIGSLGRLFNEDAFDIFLEELVSLAENQSSFEQEVQLTTAGGKQKDVLIRFSIPPESLDTLNKVIVSMQDITELSQTKETSVREKRMLDVFTEVALSIVDTPEICNRILSGLIDALSFDFGTIRLYDEKNQVLRLNASVGYAVDEVEEEIQLEDSENYVTKVAGSKKPIFIQDAAHDPKIQIQLPEIEPRQVQSIVYYPILGADESFIGVLKIANQEDKEIAEETRSLLETVIRILATILERKWAEEQVRESEERYRLLAENIVDVIITLDTSLRFTYLSPSVKVVFGYTVEEALSKTISELLTRESLEVFVSTYAEILAVEESGRRYEDTERPVIEVEVYRKDGTKIWVDISNTLLYDDEGKHIGSLGVARDITRRKQAEEQLEEAKTRVEFYNDLMAHDLTNMHQGIIVSLELMLIDPELPENLRNFAENALTQIKRGAELIANVKTLTRLDEEKGQLSKMDPFPILENAIEVVMNSYPTREIQVKTNFIAGQFEVLADHFLLEIFYNLLHNAVKADTSKKVDIEVMAELINEDCLLKIVFSDKGSGVSDKHKVRILTRLQDRETRGSGLGLTLVNQIINRYNGRVYIKDRVEGDYRQGARFVLILSCVE